MRAMEEAAGEPAWSSDAAMEQLAANVDTFKESASFVLTADEE